MEFVKSESTVKPEELEVGESTVYFRKDIKEEVRKNEDKTETTFYTYEEATQSLAEFNANMLIKTEANQISIMKSLAELQTVLNSK